MGVIKRALLAATAATLFGMGGFAVAPTLAAGTYTGWCQTATRSFYYWTDSSHTTRTNTITERATGCWNASISGITSEEISVTRATTLTSFTVGRSAYAYWHKEFEWAYSPYHYHANTEMRVYPSSTGSTTWGEWNWCYRTEDKNTWASCGYAVSGVSTTPAVYGTFYLVY